MTVMTIATTVGLVSPAGSTVATLDHVEVEWTEDEGASPSVIATVTIANPTRLQFAMLRPGAGYYLSITADSAGAGGVSPPMLLKIADRGRTMDGRVRIQATSAELDLQSFTPSAVDRSNWGRQGSAYSILSDVLTKVFGNGRWARYLYVAGYGQDIGAPAYRTYSAATNLCTNGGFEYGTTGWVGTYASIAASTTQKHGGVYSMTLTPNTSNQTASRAALVQNLQAGTTYTLSAWIRTNGVMTGSGASDGRKVYVVGATAGTVSRIAETPMAPNVANQWNRVSVTFTTPALMDAGSFELRVLNGTTTANLVTMWVDDLLLVEGDATEADGSTITYFDGDTVDGTDGYNYDWQGAAGNGSSTRTPIVDRDPETLTWSPGQSAWDFITPIMQSLGLRFWSTGYSVLNGAVVAKVYWASNDFGLNLRTVVQDTVNLFDLEQIDSWTATFPDGTPMYADQVILHYTWRDALGSDHEAFDVYPAAGKKSWTIELNDTPFAGTGRAQGIYNRISARATMFSGLSSFNRGLTPGVQIALTAEAAGGSVTGYIDAVTWDPLRGTCQFRTKQTVAYTSASWFAASGSWASQTGSWAADL